MKAAKDAKGESRGSVFVNFAKIFAFFAFPINVESAKRRELEKQKTQSSLSEARKGRRGKEPRGSVFGSFAKGLCVLCVSDQCEEVEREIP